MNEIQKYLNNFKNSICLLKYNMQCNAHVFLPYQIINLDLWPQLMSRTISHLLTDSVALKWNSSRVASHIH